MSLPKDIIITKNSPLVSNFEISSVQNLFSHKSMSTGKSGVLAILHDNIGNFIGNILSCIQHFFQNSIKLFVADQIPRIVVFQE